MGNGQHKGKEAERVQKPPKGALFMGEDGRIKPFVPENEAGDAAEETQNAPAAAQTIQSEKP